MPTPPLKVYRASAGSGKTFTLTVEYIILLIIDPNAYKHILAVTFTNKATAEMKSRILSTLEMISKNDNDADSYFQAIKNAHEIANLKLSDSDIRKRAGIALHNLAHDYSRFHIETIDSFFVSVIKDIAHELGLPANLNIDLDSEEVLSNAVDNIIDGISQNDETFNSLTDFISEKMEEDKNWKIDDEIKEFGKNIFNEKFLKDYPRLKDKINNRQYLQAYKKILSDKKKKALGEAQSLGSDFIYTCEIHGLNTNNFKQKDRGVYGFFSKLSAGKEIPSPNTYVTNCLNGPDEWNKTDDNVRLLVQSILMPLLRKTLEKLPDITRTISTVNAISRHLNHLQLFTAISNEIDRLNVNADRFLLANSAYFLQRMIDKSSVPFIYEKSGTKFSHIMIDEFQDTSDLQWNNFLPLLNNSLDAGKSCLIVGDVKQSIYRFRNSDWNILNTIDINQELTGKVNTPPPLNTNRRSMGNVISFNNVFFKTAVTLFNEEYKTSHNNEDCSQLLKAYSDVEQQIVDSKKDKGYVRIDLIGHENNDNVEYSNSTFLLLKQHIDSLLSKGLKQKDITILLRFNKDIARISEYFAENAPDLHLVSDEAYQLSSSRSINIIINVLRYLINTDDKPALASLVANTTDMQYSRLLLFDKETLKGMLPTDFTDNIETLPYMPIKDLVETIYDVFDLKKIQGQDAYMFFFHDKLTEFMDERNNDISSLLKYWDEKLSAKTIPSNNAANGIRIMSIHKSKGLEFHTVIIPLCDWATTGKSSDLLWCSPDESPYNQLPLVPINYTKEVANSIFRDEYDAETLRNNVDNLNLLYVAFTRARNNLFILSAQPKSKEKKDEKGISDISKLICRVLSADTLKCHHVSGDSQEDGICTDSYETGELITKTENEIISDSETIMFSTSSRMPEFKQSNKSKDFVSETDTSYIDKGLLYHSILERINVASDLDPVILKMHTEGVFRSDEEMRQAKHDLEVALSDPVASRWFDGSWTVINERAILVPVTDKNLSEGSANYKESRPDRVIISPTETIIIDYKIGHYDNEHFDQVKRYMNLYSSMGYPGVKGYIWYIIKNKTYRVRTDENNGNENE